MSDHTLYTPESMLDEIMLVYDNLIFERSGDVWAQYELATQTYGMLARQTKMEIHGQLVSVLNQLPPLGRAKIIITGQDFDRERYLQDLASVNPEDREYRKWMGEIEKALIQRDRGSRKKVYLSVRLSRDIFPPLRRAARGEYQALFGWFRQRVLGSLTPVPDDEIANAKATAAQVRNLLSGMLVESPVPGEPHPGPIEIARLIRHLYQRGIAHDDIPAMGTLWERHEHSRVLVPCAQAWRALVSDTTIKSKYSHLVLYHGNGKKTYQKFLGISAMPTSDMYYPGDEYAYPKKGNADILLDVDLTPGYEAERRREGKEQRLDAQKEHQLTAGNKIDLGMQEATIAHREMEASFRAGEPNLGLHACYCVSADTLQGVNQKARDLTDELKRHRITLTETRAAHPQAFADFLPAGTRRLRSYHVPMPPRTLAGAAPTANDHVGDDEGPFLAVTHRTASPVFFNPARGMTISQNSAVAYVGAQGSGKSMTMYTIFAQLCLAGYWQILLDPKGDARHISKLNELSGSLHEVSVEPGTDVALPILKLYPLSEIQKTWRIVRDFLIQMFGALENQTELDEYKRDIIRMATDKFVGWFEDSGGTLKVEELKNAFRAVADHEEIIGKTQEITLHLAHLLDTYSKNDLTSVVLSDEGDVFNTTAGEGIATGDPRSIIFYTHELKLQSAEARANNIPPTEDERMAQAVMSVVAAAAYELAGKQRFLDEKVFRGVHVDEAWQITSNSTGKILLDFLSRQARSQWVGSFLASQKWADLEEMKDNLGAIFLGRNPSKQDVKNALTHMGVTPDDRTATEVSNYSNGNFVFKDIDGRVAPIQVRPTPPRWLDLMDTTPGKTRQSINRRIEPVRAS